MRIEKHGRYFKVMDGEELVCICLYKVGATEVVRRLNNQGGSSHESDNKQAADH